MNHINRHARSSTYNSRVVIKQRGAVWPALLDERCFEASYSCVDEELTSINQFHNELDSMRFDEHLRNGGYETIYITGCVNILTDQDRAAFVAMFQTIPEDFRIVLLINGINFVDNPHLRTTVQWLRDSTNQRVTISMD